MTGSDAALVVAHGLGDAGDLPLPFDAVVLLSGGAVLATLVAGHVAAVVVANDCAAATRPPRSARAVQVPLRAVLVVSMLASVFVRFGGGRASSSVAFGLDVLLRQTAACHLP